ncbi:MAG: phage tail assembly protein [Acidobacteriia bacterium]|nr:phage tail assembly protein [Terriglobia bacterium]
MTAFPTEFEFVLPRGYVDPEGKIHREGMMRLATAADEILPLKDSRVQSNPAYLICILLGRVVTQLGSLDAINPKVIEGLFAGDLAFLQDFYNRINGNGTRTLKVLCPRCQEGFEVEPGHLGES